MIVPFVPRVLREKFTAMDERLRCVSTAAGWFGRYDSRASRMQTQAWLRLMEMHFDRVRGRVLARWYAGEISVDEAIALIDEELVQGAPRFRAPPRGV